MKIDTFVKIANEYRKQINAPGGVIVFHKSIPEAWLNELRDPQKFIPGSIAVDALGQKFIAAGGNAYDGATEWLAA